MSETSTLLGILGKTYHDSFCDSKSSCGFALGDNKKHIWDSQVCLSACVFVCVCLCVCVCLWNVRHDLWCKSESSCGFALDDIGDSQMWMKYLFNN